MAGVLIERVEQIRDAVWLWARPRAETAVCAGCGQESARVHSHYERRLADAAVAGQRVTERLRIFRTVDLLRSIPESEGIRVAES